MKRQKHPKLIDISAEQIKEALYKNYGVLTDAMAYLQKVHGISITRNTLMERIETFFLEDYLEECRAMCSDLATGKLTAAILAGEAWAITLQLKTAGHKAGFHFSETEAMVKAKYANEVTKPITDGLSKLEDMLKQIDSQKELINE